MAIEKGKLAPDFELPGTTGDKKIKLSDFLGKKNVVLFFFPLAFSPVCSLEMPNFEKHMKEFQEKNTEIFAISVDSLYTLKAFAGHCQVASFTMLSDFHPKGEVADLYSVYDAEKGIAQRATIVIDKKGLVCFSHVNELIKERDVNKFLDVLAELNK